MCLGSPRDPPVKAGVINQHDRVWSMMAKVAVGFAAEVPKLVNVHKRVQQPHHGQLGEVLVKLTTGRRHPRPTVTYTLAVRATSLQLTNEIRPVQVAARFADREED